MQVPLQYLSQPPQWLLSLRVLKQPPLQISGNPGGHPTRSSSKVSVEAADKDETVPLDGDFEAICFVFSSRPSVPVGPLNVLENVDDSGAAQILKPFWTYPSTHWYISDLLMQLLFMSGLVKSGHVHTPWWHTCSQAWLQAPQCALSAMKLTHPLPKQKSGNFEPRMHPGFETGLL